MAKNRPAYLKVIDDSEFTLENLFTTGRVTRTYELYAKPQYKVKLRTLLAQESNAIPINEQATVKFAALMLVKLNEADYAALSAEEKEKQLVGQSQFIVERINTAIQDLIEDTRALGSGDDAKKG